MKKFFFLGWLLSLCLSALAQGMLKTVCQFPTKISEVSGIIGTFESNFIVLNDGGNPNELYLIDTSCSILRTVVISNSTNRDWEELTKDNKGNLFIGEFGNNLNDRKDLQILKVDSLDFIEKDTLTALVIPFRYENQLAFPPEDARLNFDMEAMIWLRDSLYLFSKNRTSPFTGFTYVYSIADDGSDSIAHLRDSFFAGSGFKEFFWVTGAAYQAKDSQLFLLSSDKFWRIKFPGTSSLIGPTVEQIALGSFTQKESITILPNSDIYVADEVHNLLGGGYLYKWIPSQATNVKESHSHLSHSISHDDSGFKIDLTHPAILKGVYNQSGQSIFFQKTNHPQTLWNIRVHEHSVYYLAFQMDQKLIWIKLLH